MARELAPAGLRSRPSLFKPKAGAASRPSGSKLPRHSVAPASGQASSRQAQGFASGVRSRQRRNSQSMPCPRTTPASATLPNPPGSK
ncbi:hypothetical protein EXW72_14090 [Pseudomonas sp. BCA14]|nr:hypothetical protein EXW70_17115 [Pseudomonas sp. JMN1]TFF11118.1 hypothetical protein EXW71_15195 [Pseudomonas sp. BCA17]TFF22729.1 hypothetical protein EXW73_20675 [Pseudomonas sp. BCA13]TFF26213.1 hypothetical protein EXW72_14090 [Pseudomonas sp. BCA14]